MGSFRAASGCPVELARAKRIPMSLDSEEECRTRHLHLGAGGENGGPQTRRRYCQHSFPAHVRALDAHGIFHPLRPLVARRCSAFPALMAGILINLLDPSGVIGSVLI